MKVRRSYDAEGEPTYRISFELTQKELIEAGWITRFSEMWEHSRMAKDYLEFLAKFSGIIGQDEPDYGDLYRKAKEEETRAKAERVRQQFTGSFQQGYAYGFDFGGFNSGPKMQWDEYPKVDPAWCKVLGLPKTATQAEIKNKYRELAKLHHPDKGGNAKKFAEITNAYEEAIQ